MQVKPNELIKPPGLAAGSAYPGIPTPDIEELLAYKEYLEKELHRVKTELRKKVQR
jgi:hypothetical protein